MTGQRLLHYEIVEKLGEGGMGVVYKARDTHLDRFVAIKLLPAEKVADPSRKARFVQEAKAASALNHPNIITVHDISCHAGRDFIAMEFVAGKTLNQLIPRKGMRLNEALKIAVQIADALARAHAAGIVHRDLKPSNIMVDEHGQVKVLDFGLAKLTEQGISQDDATATMGVKTDEKTIVGTPAYMSPEQAEGNPVDARSDIFSFGAVLYEMVTGQRAFTGSSAASVLAAVIKQQPKPAGEIVPAISRDFEKLFARCLQKQPGRRWQTMADLCVALGELREESDSQAVAAPVRVSVIRGVWRRVALLALPAVLAMGWLFWRRQGELPPPRLVQLTSYVGSESAPSFSPDGSQIAFAWGGEKADNTDIYVKLVGEASALRLTTDPTVDNLPAWSPDGKRIAFRRQSTDATSSIFLVSPLGGPERKLAEVPTVGRMSWSPDGKWLAIARGSIRNAAIHLLPVTGGETVPVTRPASPAWDWSPAFSRDGKQLAYVGCTGISTCDLYVQELRPGGSTTAAPRRVTRQEMYMSGLAWSGDGGSLIYGASVAEGVLTYLWRADVRGRRTPERLEIAGVHASLPAPSPTGQRLAFTRSMRNTDLWQYQPGQEQKPFMESSVIDWSPQFSADGKKVAFNSALSGETFEVWVCDADGSNRLQITNRVGRYQGTPVWCPDGGSIVFDSQGDDGHWGIYIIGANGGNPRRITETGIDCNMPSWSRDGKWIYHRSNRTGKHEIWRTSSQGGQSKQVTRNGGFNAFESYDGLTLYYTKAEPSSVFAMPLAGGQERQIIDYVSYRGYAVMPDGIYYIGRRGGDNLYPLSFHDFARGSSRELTRLDQPANYGLAVSPDRRRFIYCRLVSFGSDLMMIENFR